MARQITVAFAVDGNRVEVPVPTQISGEVSYQTGYTFDYSRPVSDPQAKNIERVKLNAVLYDITGVLQQFQQQGAPEWYADTPYAQFARVKHGGNYYVAAVDGTEQEPGTGEEWSLDNIAAQARKNNLTATTDPTATNDESEGYEPLSQWINTVSGEVFIAITVAEGAAVWQQGTFTVDELGNVALLNANAIGQAIIQSPNPSAVRFMRANADNSVSWLSAEDFRTALSLTNTDGLPEGSTNQYFTQARVRSSTLTGFAAGVGFTAVIATDTIIQALQKIQGWLSSLGTASQANLVTSSTDTTAGRATTVGWMGLGGPGVNVSFANNDFSSLIATGMGAPNAIYSVGLHIRGTANTAGNIAIRNNGLYHQSLESGILGDWLRVWDTDNLVKTSSPTDITTGRMPVSGWLGNGRTLAYKSQATDDLNDFNVAGAHGMWGGSSLNRPTNSVYVVHVLGGSPSSSEGQIPSRLVQVAYQVGGAASYRRSYNGTSWSPWVEEWNSSNLVKTMSAADTTAGSVPTVGWMNLGSTDQQPGGSYDWATSPTRFMSTNVNGPSSFIGDVFIRGIHVLIGTAGFNIGGREGRAFVQTPGYAGLAGEWKELWTTGNTSADVQAMLGAADNEAIRSSIGTAKKLAVANVSTADHFVTAGNESLYHRFTFNGAKTVTVRPNSTHALPADGSWVLRNVGTGNLTIVEGSGVTINPPYGGTLVLEPRMTVTLQKVGTNEYDLIGQTVPA